MALNIRQLAELAGVATSTISRATNPRTRKMLSAETLAKIDALIRKHGYVPSIAARQLKNPGAMKVGVILPYYDRMFYHSYYIHVLAGIADALIDTDYSFRLIMLKPRRKKWDWYDFQIGEGVEGVVVTHWQSVFAARFLAKADALPHVVINDYDDSVNSRFVCEDSESGGRLAAAHFYELGHREVAVITGNPDSRDSASRLKGFLDFWREKDLPVPATRVAQGDFGGGERVKSAVDFLMMQKIRPTGIFTCNDRMAVTACERLVETGLGCPDDVSIIGYDDAGEYAHAFPALTTIRQPLYEIARTAARLLVAHLSGESTDALSTGNTPLPVELIRRDSVRAIQP